MLLGKQAACQHGQLYFRADAIILFPSLERCATMANMTSGLREQSSHNDASFRAFGMTLRALCTIADQTERGRRYRQALVARHPQMAATFTALGYSL